ncbi:Phospholipase/carboxylesterase/thioesterase [Flammula alnicola]|nr:Phospholipase/carboxylesterase/thioesterase [Flammula alnicola]
MAVAPVLKYLTVPATAKHTATGLGDTGHGWRPVADMFKADPALTHVKWLLPHSPVRSVRANMGIEMPSWFDIYSFGFDTEEDEKGMRESASNINQLINYEIEANGIDPSRIVLGGFSQGGTMTLLSGLTGQHSGWLPLRDKFKEMASQNAASTPIFWGAGNVDPLVKAQYSKDSRTSSSSSLACPARNLGMGHTTTPRELDELKAFIKAAIPKN